MNKRNKLIVALFVSLLNLFTWFIVMNYLDSIERIIADIGDNPSFLPDIPYVFVVIIPVIVAVLNFILLYFVENVIVKRIFVVGSIVLSIILGLVGFVELQNLVNDIN